jgi:hypothetical protein
MAERRFDLTKAAHGGYMVDGANPRIGFRADAFSKVAMIVLARKFS